MDEIDPRQPGPQAGGREIYTVSRLNREVRRLLETRLPVLWVEGEISNLARPGSGHWYFSLKDASAQVRCAMFRQRNRLLAFTPANGDQVMIRGRVGIYEPRGEYQFIAEHMEPAGEGALRQAFELLKARLDSEGLFALDHKQPLPALPGCIGVITSPTGAAVRDVLKVLKRRFPAIPVVIYPVAVQGAGAAQQIAEALDTAARRQECDVIILARGGGSLEDLRAFNEEQVARAVYASAIPVVCGVGHEVDVTIADLVADLRAPTPSAAAEMVAPDRVQWLRALRQASRRASASMRRILDQSGDLIRTLNRRLSLLHPAQPLRQHNQRIDEIEQRLLATMKQVLRTRQANLLEQSAHLQRLSPANRIQAMSVRHGNLAQRMATSMRHRIESATARLAVSSGTLNAISPLATLERGYAIIQHDVTGDVIRSAGQVRPDEIVSAKLGQGQLRAKVIEIKKDDKK